MFHGVMKTALALAVVAFATMADQSAAQSVNAANRADPGKLQPGLSVCYIYALVRHINEIPGWESSKTCEEGPPLPKLDYKVGQESVLTSDASDGVLAKITGYIHFPAPGFYGFAFESNDGVRLEIDGHLVVEDPDVHGDRFSDIGGLEVAEPGWYPLLIRYFERKNTSTLKFYWQPPGVEGTMPIVPAEALAHGS